MDASKKMPVTTEPQSSAASSRVVLGQASSLSHIDVSTQADIHHAATSYESEDEIMGRRSNRVGSGTDMSRCNKRGTPLYSKEDIREQYCITSRQLDVLDKRRGGGDAGTGVSGGFFGCLSTYSENSPCSASGRSSLLSVCVRRKVPSDENLYELCRRQPADYAPIPRYPRYPFGAVPPELYQYDENLDCSYFRRRPKSFCTMADPKRYTWMPEDEESIRMERPRPIRPDLDEYDSIQRPRPASRQSTLSGGTVTPHYMSYSSEYLPAVHGHYVCPAHPDLPPPPPPPLVPTVVHRTKHVSFARSHTLTSFDDAKISIATRSQERLLDGKKTADPLPLSRQGDGSESPKIVVLEKVKRGPMKTQATQTEVCLGRKPLPPNQLSLSPRTIHRVRMVSQGAQTNGLLNNGRKLTKSFSEAGSRFGVGTVAPPTGQQFQFNESQKSPTLEHEPLQRTQSEEPPKSPFLILSSPPSPTPPVVVESPEKETSASEKESERSDREETDSETKSQKEIIIDFEPQLSPDLIEPIPKKRVLLKTMSEGEILQERRKSQITDHELIPDNMIISTSQENIKTEPEQARSFTPYFLNSPILHEDIFKEPPSGPPSTVFSPITSNLRIQESIDEEFHENLICGTLFRKRSVSMEDGVSSTSDPDLLEVQQKSTPKSAPSSPGMDTLGRSESKISEDDGVVPTCKTISPFASSDSLANDLRDHSDGIWNESQATVLQADSGTENGTVLSTSDLSSLTTAVSPSVTLLTPSSRRKHLLMLQHQQRSSMDTDALEEEFQADQIQVQSPALPRLKKDISTVGVHVLPPPPIIAVTTPPKSADTSHISSPVPPTRRSPARGELRKRRSPLSRTPDLTPSETPHRSLESPDNTKAIQTAAEMLLQKNDSGKTTDISESTTTTDDYVTANSDSSRRSGSLQGTSTQSTHGSQTGTQDGSSFESASSIYSLARGEAVCEDMIVPSFSPPPIIEETISDIPLSPAAESKCPTPPISQRRASSKEPTSPSGTSSSSGSYSLNGSCDNLHRQPDHQQKDQRSKTEHKPIVPSPPRTTPKGESISDDECSAHYSSGYYESPGDEDVETDSRRKISRRADRKEWTEDEKRRRKKGFTLDFNRREKEVSSNGQQREKSEKTPTEEAKAVDKKSPSSLSPKDIAQSKQVHEKPKRVKSRSPQRPQRKLPQAASSSAVPYASKKSDKEVTTPGMVRSPAMHDGFRPEDWAIVRTPPHEEVPQISTNAGTSDESSGGFSKKEPNNIQQLSPRRHRRIRETARRKSGPNLVCSRSPTSSLQRVRRRSGSIEDKSISLPGSLPRRRSSMQPKSNIEEDTVSELTPKSNRLSPHKYTRSPGGSPRKIRSPKTAAEGSPETKLKAVSAESLRSVSPGSDSVFYSESGSNTATMTDQHQCVHCLHCGKEVDIVTTDDIEEGALHDKDQPDIVRPPAGFADSPDGPRVKHTSGRLYKKLEKRYRSEERSHGERRHHHRYKQDMRAKSEERGKDDTTRIKLRPLARSTDASLEVLKATASSPSVTNVEDEDDMGIYAESYRNAIWIFIGDSEEMHVWHRPDTPRHTDDDEHSIGEFSDIGIRTRKESDSSTGSTESEHEFKKKYQCVTHRMVHRKSCLEMYKRQADKSFESDKTVIVRRECGEFGFRIHGSKPVVVSAIEPDTPAESSGLEVGDIVIAVNGINVLDKSHSEVVKIAHAGSDTLRLEVARTCDVLAPADEPGGGSTDSLYSGYLWKFVTHNNKWIRRWFVLKRNNCLYYYKTDAESQPVGAIMLINYDVTRTTPECAGGKQYAFSVTKPGYTGLQLAADNEEAATRWIAVISHAVERSTAADTWLETAKRNLRVAPIQLPKPDCFGYLMKLGTKWKSWNKRYCVLKDACLYFYHDANAKNAFGMTCLHGYRVQQAAPAGKKHAFEVIPPDPSQKHLYFHTESDLDRKRWLAALEYSIDRWLRVG